MDERAFPVRAGTLSASLMPGHFSIKLYLGMRSKNALAFVLASILFRRVTPCGRKMLQSAFGAY
jgi:hypothetical protein